ncbi:MAG TPA: hypothetical protein EYQ63_11650 [Fuerstia sp.]|nr:hypothetical protein [Fuerstiella sp.]
MTNRISIAEVWAKSVDRTGSPAVKRRAWHRNQPRDYCGQKVAMLGLSRLSSSNILCIENHVESDRSVH